MITPPDRSFRRRLKRAIDILLSSAALLLLAPLLFAIALAILTTMGPPILFRQERIGRQSRPFTVVKFRTMRRPRAGEIEADTDGVRLTPLGARLRRFSLDELPELWCVLTGEMSLVGPRPLLTHYLAHFSERERLRFEVLPGITGWAQVHGRNHASWDQRLAADAWYAENWSLRLDLRILLMTARQVVLGSGVVTDPRSAMLDLDRERAVTPPDLPGATRA